MGTVDNPRQEALTSTASGEVTTGDQTDELLERLRDFHDDWPAQEICQEAAQTIMGMRRRIWTLTHQLEEALDDIEYMKRAARGSDF